MLPAEKTHYRRGLTLGLTLAEVFTIIVFILLITCTVLLRSIGEERDEAERERDEAETDLTLARDMLRGEESWLDADAWYSEVRRLRYELAEARIRIDSVQMSLREAQAAEEEARRLLSEEMAAEAAGEPESEGVRDRIAQRVMEQESAIATQTDSIKRLNEVLGQERARADSIAQETETIERFAQAVLDSRAATVADSTFARAQPSPPAPASRAEQGAQPTNDESETVHDAQDIRENIASQVATDDALASAIDEIAEVAEVQRVREELEEERRANRKLRQQVEEYMELDNWDAADSLSRTAAELEAIRREAVAIRRQTAAITRQTAAITRDFSRMERERNQAVELVEYYRAAELRRLEDGSGIDAPPCWFDSVQRSPEYIFEIELTEGGFRVSNVAPADRNGDPALLHANRIDFEYGREFAPEAFRRLARPIYDLGVADTATFGPKGCRYYVYAVDRTGTDKDVFRRRLELIENHFYYAWR